MFENPKSEFLNPKKYRIFKKSSLKTVLNISGLKYVRIEDHGR